MTGVSMDLLTVILLVVLAAICGYSAGHKTGRHEVQQFTVDAIERINKTMEETAKARKEEIENKADSFTRFMDMLTGKRNSFEQEKKEDGRSNE